jgi:hypothetical protein
MTIMSATYPKPNAPSKFVASVIISNPAPIVQNMNHV